MNLDRLPQNSGNKLNFKIQDLISRLGEIIDIIEPINSNFTTVKYGLKAGRAELYNLAKLIYTMNRFRNNAEFGFGEFSDPAWDILLDLYICEFKSKPVSITSAGFASGVAPTTALRWIRMLQQKKLIIRSPDSIDRRRHFLNLTDSGRTLINETLAYFWAGIQEITKDGDEIEERYVDF